MSGDFLVRLSRTQHPRQLGLAPGVDSRFAGRCWRIHVHALLDVLCDCRGRRPGSLRCRAQSSTGSS
jgi:hypothetical protein